MPHLRVSLHLNLRHLFVGAVLQVDKVLGGVSTDPPGCSAEGELGGVRKRTGGVEPPQPPRQFSPWAYAIKKSTVKPDRDLL